jgi:hypothetical protein
VVPVLSYPVCTTETVATVAMVATMTVAVGIMTNAPAARAAAAATAEMVTNIDLLAVLEAAGRAG